MTSEFNPLVALEALAKLEKLQKQIDDAVKEIKGMCTCPEDQCEKREYYFSGSYDDKAYTDYWDECKICGKRYNKETKSHSWYG